VTSVSVSIAPYQVILFKFFSLLSYANSAINPFLYAFTNDAFKSAFADAFRCVTPTQSQHPSGRGDARKRNADDGDKGAGDAVPQVVVEDHAGCQGQSSAIQLKTMATTTSITGQTQVRKVQVASDLLPRATSAVMTRVIVHLEQQ